MTIAGRSEDRLKGAVALLEAKVEGPSRVFYSVCDVTIESDVKSTLKSAYENGGKKLNAVVMSAGANFGVKNIPHVDLETWNVRGDRGCFPKQSSHDKDALPANDRGEHDICLSHDQALGSLSRTNHRLASHS